MSAQQRSKSDLSIVEIGRSAAGEPARLCWHTVSREGALIKKRSPGTSTIYEYITDEDSICAVAKSGRFAASSRQKDPKTLWSDPKLRNPVTM